MATSYGELLRDPRWQRKRLEIFNRDGFSCVCCGSQDKTLSVHHHYYISGRKPWEYSDETLVTLCDQCHANEESLKESDDDVLRLLLCSGLLRKDVQSLISLIHQKSGNYNPSLFRQFFNRILDLLKTRDNG